MNQFDWKNRATTNKVPSKKGCKDAFSIYEQNYCERDAASGLVFIAWNYNSVHSKNFQVLAIKSEQFENWQCPDQQDNFQIDN